MARAATRTILGGYLGIDARQVQWGYHGHGKPVVDGLRHNLSHSADHALLAVTADRAVGVDIEAGPLTAAPLRLADRFFLPAEARALRRAPQDQQRQRYLRLWTRKEACVKAAAGALRHGLRLAVVPSRGHSGTGAAAPRREPPGTGAVVRCRTGAMRGCWWISDLPVAAPLVAAVAVAGPRPCRIRVRHWDTPWSIAGPESVPRTGSPVSGPTSRSAFGRAVQQLTDQILDV